jgi:hypothetical protein
MLAIDLVGLIITMGLVSVRYPHYAMAAALANALGQVVMAILLAGNIEKMISAGVFSSATVTNLSDLKIILFTLSGPITNFVLSKIAGGTEFVSTAQLWNPVAVLKHPLAVINLRFATISLLFSIFQFFQ